MKIRFLKTDPRAGMVAALDSRRAYQLVESGSAEFVDERHVEPAKPEAAAPEPKPDSKPKAKRKVKKHDPDA